jgi:hypothetical protein
MTTSYISKSRKDRLIQERVHDPYKARQKPPEPSVCPTCKAVLKDGRWQWLASWVEVSHKELCQACQRIRDNYPAGQVTVRGDFARKHKAELLNLIRNHEQGERALHPLHRIIRIEERPEVMVVSTTDIHLPKRIGEALRHIYKGRLDLHYDKECCFVRVDWNSNPE